MYRHFHQYFVNFYTPTVIFGVCCTAQIHAFVLSYRIRYTRTYTLVCVCVCVHHGSTAAANNIAVGVGITELFAVIVYDVVRLTSTLTIPKPDNLHFLCVSRPRPGPVCLGRHSN